YGDVVDELDEVWCVDLTNPTGGAVINDGMGLGTIADDDTAQVSLAGVSALEGNSGTTALPFTLRLPVPRDRFVSVDCATADDTAGRLRAASPGRGASPAGLRPESIAPLLGEAVRRWSASGVDVSGLSDLAIRIADLPGTTLGLAAGHTITLDADASGWGWFV